MNRLLSIEWLKLKHYRPFWVLSGLYFLVLALVCSSVMLFFQYLESKGADIEGISPTMIPFYDFTDIWQNLTYLASFFKIFLGFVVVISICNEWNFHTLRQNIIDGMDKWEFLMSKLLIILALTLFNTAFLVFLGMGLGSIYSPVTGVDVIFQNFVFVLAYFLDVFAFLVFSLFVGMLVKKTGFAIVLLALYSLFLEPIAYVILLNTFEGIPFYEYLPIRSMNKLIEIPYGRYLFREVKDYLVWYEVLIVVGYIALFYFGSFRMLKAKDVA